MTIVLMKIIVAKSSVSNFWNTVWQGFARAAQRAIEDFEGQFVQTEEQQTGNGLPKELDVPIGKKKAEF